MSPCVRQACPSCNCTAWQLSCCGLAAKVLVADTFSSVRTSSTIFDCCSTAGHQVINLFLLLLLLLVVRVEPDELEALIEAVPKKLSLVAITEGKWEVRENSRQNRSSQSKSTYKDLEELRPSSASRTQYVASSMQQQQ